MQRSLCIQKRLPGFGLVPRIVHLSSAKTRSARFRAELRCDTLSDHRQVRYLVNSHHHPDHWSGNEVLVEAFTNLEIIATEESRRYILNIANALRKRY
jgi:glyoxylase-like metal-dependent hydrolase (beta-lactamase superfamily II)